MSLSMQAEAAACHVIATQLMGEGALVIRSWCPNVAITIVWRNAKHKMATPSHEFLLFSSDIERLGNDAAPELLVTPVIKSQGALHSYGLPAACKSLCDAGQRELVGWLLVPIVSVARLLINKLVETNK